MSILNRGTDLVTVFAEQCHPSLDGDGNKVANPSTVGQVLKAVVQPLSSSEKADIGYTTEAVYRLRLIGFPYRLGANSQVEWRCKRYSIVGDGMDYHSSSRTSHTTYTMVRG